MRILFRIPAGLLCVLFFVWSSCQFFNGTCAKHVMVSKFQWKPFCLAALSAEWLDWMEKWCELWRIRTGPIFVGEKWGILTFSQPTPVHVTWSECSRSRKGRKWRSDKSHDVITKVVSMKFQLFDIFLRAQMVVQQNMRQRLSERNVAGSFPDRDDQRLFAPSAHCRSHGGKQSNSSFFIFCPASFSDHKLALVGIIPNQILFSFSSDKERRTDSRHTVTLPASCRRDAMRVTWCCVM